MGSLGWHVDGSGCGDGLHHVDGGDGSGPVHRLTPWMVSMERLAGPWSMMTSAINHHFDRVLHVGDLGGDGNVGADLCHHSGFPLACQVVPCPPAVAVGCGLVG